MKFGSKEELEGWLMDSLSTQADIPREEIRADMSFAALGVDSVESVAIAAALDGVFDDFTIKPALFWEVSNIRELAGELFKKLEESAVG